MTDQGVDIHTYFCRLSISLGNVPLGQDGIIGLYLDGTYGGQHHVSLLWGQQDKTDHVWQVCTKERPNILFCR